jgi:hypothetical protein
MDKISRDKCLYFKGGYKYQVSRLYRILLAVVPFAPIDLPFIKMGMDGKTSILPGYAWNGASGPTWDTLNSMIGSLIHDVLYQLIRLGLISSDYKPYADEILKEICIEDGMFEWRAACWKWAVMEFGAGSTKPSAEPQEEVAP